MTQRRTTIWGWGFEDEQPTPEQKKNIAKGIAESVGASDFSLDPEPRVEDIPAPHAASLTARGSCQHLLDRNLRPRGPCLWQSSAPILCGPSVWIFRTHPMWWPFPRPRTTWWPF